MLDEYLDIITELVCDKYPCIHECLSIKVGTKPGHPLNSLVFEFRCDLYNGYESLSYLIRAELQVIFRMLDLWDGYGDRFFWIEFVYVHNSIFA